MENNRADERVEMLGALHGEVTVYQPVAILELSRLGAQVESSFPLALNSLHDFRFQLHDQPVVLKGRVVHCRITDVDQETVVYRSGIEFVEPSSHVALAIERFLDGIKEGRRSV